MKILVCVIFSEISSEIYENSLMYIICIAASTVEWGSLTPWSITLFVLVTQLLLRSVLLIVVLPLWVTRRCSWLWLPTLWGRTAMKPVPADRPSCCTSPDKHLWSLCARISCSSRTYPVSQHTHTTHLDL